MDAASVSYGKATSYLPVIDLLEGYFQNRGPGRSPEDARLRLDAFPPEGANELLRTLWRVTTVSSTACRSRASRERADD